MFLSVLVFSALFRVSDVSCFPRQLCDFFRSLPGAGPPRLNPKFKTVLCVVNYMSKQGASHCFFREGCKNCDAFRGRVKSPGNAMPRKSVCKCKCVLCVRADAARCMA